MLDYICLFKIGSQKIWKQHVGAIFKYVNAVLMITPGHSISKLITTSVDSKR